MFQQQEKLALKELGSNYNNSNNKSEEGSVFADNSY